MKPFRGKRFIGDKGEMEVHDLENEQTACEIDKIDISMIQTFSPDSLKAARGLKYCGCRACLGKISKAPGTAAKAGPF